jgi:hypothetical protein
MKADVQVASTAVRAAVIVLSVVWLGVLAWFPGRWIMRLFRERDRSE